MKLRTFFLNESENMAGIDGCFRVRWEAHQKGDPAADLGDASVCASCRFNVMAPGEARPGCYQNMSDLSLGTIYDFLEDIDPEGRRAYLDIIEAHEAACRRKWQPVPEEKLQTLRELCARWKEQIAGMSEDDLAETSLLHPNNIDNVELLLEMILNFAVASEKLGEPVVFFWPLPETAAGRA